MFLNGNTASILCLYLIYPIGTSSISDVKVSKR